MRRFLRVIFGSFPFENLKPEDSTYQRPIPVQSPGSSSDVVEDTPWTLEVLRKEGFSEEVVAALDALTKRPGEAYDAFIGRVAANPIARRVKRADLMDNLDLRRLPAVTEADCARLARYRAALAQLG